MVENITLDCEIENSEMDYDFSTLPPHIIANVLCRLDIQDFTNASLACKSWYYASCDPMIAKYLCLSFNSVPHDSADIFIRPVTKLLFEYTNFKKVNYMTLIRNIGSNITELHIISCRCLRITQLFEMFIHLSNLKVLRLQYGNRYYKPNNFYKHKRITKHKARIMRNLGRVEELHVITNEKYLKGAEILLNYCTHLKTLYWNDKVHFDSPDYFLHDVLINPDNNCTSERLESLTVHTLDRKQNSKFFEQLINLNRTNLRSLDIKEVNETYYDVVFKEFCKTYKLLEKLTMYGCNDQQLADICKYMRELRLLDLSNVTISNYLPIGYLNNLETLTLRRPDDTSNGQLGEIFKQNLRSLTDLTLKYISGDLLEELCKSLPNLKSLYLEQVDTNELGAIFRHMTKLESLHLKFVMYTQINSKNIESDPEWNISKLVDLKYLYINTFVPGITPDLIAKLTKLTTEYHVHIYDPDPEEDTNEDENNEEDENAEENANENEGTGEEQNDGENEEQEAAEEEEQEENQADEEPEEEEDREYDIVEFDVYNVWLCDNDTKEPVICQ